MLAYVEERVRKYPHRGISALHPHAIEPSDWGLLKQVANLAAERNILVHLERSLRTDKPIVMSKGGSYG